MELVLDGDRQEGQEDFVKVRESGSELCVALPSGNNLDAETKFALQVQDGMCHELVCADWCFGILRFLVHRVMHGLVSDANRIEELSVEGSLLQDEVGVSELPVQNELISEHKDTAGGAGNYVWHFIKDNGEESS